MLALITGRDPVEGRMALLAVGRLVLAVTRLLVGRDVAATDGKRLLPEARVTVVRLVDTRLPLIVVYGLRDDDTRSVDATTRFETASRLLLTRELVETRLLERRLLAV